jgi:hypothetical protein
MEERFRQLDFDSTAQGSLVQHQQCLEALWPHLAELKSYRSCFCCFMFMPEKVLACGHAICDFCVRRFGSTSSEGRHNFEMPSCPLCGVQQPREKAIFRLVPPTAGIRMLCLDGGGIRGVVPFVFLKYLETELSLFGCSLQEMFDYVGGTSAGMLLRELQVKILAGLIMRAGGLIAIGVFLMQWSVTHCLQRFEELATSIFKPENDGAKLSWSQSLQRLLRTCVQDHRYSLSPVERAFLTGIGPAATMFNPLQTDTKIAVTATSVRSNTPCVICCGAKGRPSTPLSRSYLNRDIISNYNGGLRLHDNSEYTSVHCFIDTANCARLLAHTSGHTPP